MINGKQKIKTDEWRTPDWLFNQLNDRFNFTLDVASTKENSKCERSLQVGLSPSWGTARVFCNPPFSQKRKWIKKAYDEVLNQQCPLCVMLLPNCIDTKYFNKYIHNVFYWEHLPFRVSFCDEKNNAIPGNPSGTIIVYMWKPIVRNK